ncbi:uncharacterized protein LOC113294834 [Papaver somniferum]|uniref:uncharacterized protein LOC113294834 n=1 Tax=Papaver somniferum TaxID=3469 RepID=UPI000E6FC774|nr:uncharacterized protein LOC113294834 [Papaver somniferum]
MELLSSLLMNAATNHVISGVKAARNAPGITHLLFADDILIFSKADMHNIQGILDVLAKFGMYSGQVLNLSKSNVYFSNNINPEDINFLANALRMEEMKDNDKYLGVTLLIGRDKTKAFKPIIQSFVSRYKNWKGKTMNHSARTTMVKHVLNTLPSHQMGSFRIPKKLITQMDTLQRQFWWGKEKDLYFIGWSKLMIPKALGGLGFRNLEHFNTALLSKVAWRSCNDEESLCFKVLKAKYSKDGSFLHLDKLKDECSWLWRGLFSGLEIIKQHTIWAVRCGTKISIWLDCWVIGLNSPPFPIVGASSYNNFNLIPTSGEDFIIWKPDRKGKFSVKSAYNTICADDVNSIISIDSTPKEIDIIAANFHSVQDWIITWFSCDANNDNVLSLHNARYVCRLMCTMWYIWKDICSLIFQGEKANVQSTTARIRNLIAQYADYTVSMSNTLNCFKIKFWVPPEKEFVKVNMDGSYIPDTIKGSIGLIIRNCAGNCIGARGMTFNVEVEEDYGAEHFECKTMELALDWMDELQQDRVIFESDCDNVINSVKEQQSQVHWFNSSIVERVKLKCNRVSKLWFFNVVHRLGNNVAHSLARKAIEDEANFCFLSDFPEVKNTITPYYINT